MSTSATMLIEIIKPYTNGFGRVIEPHPIYSIMRVGRDQGAKLVDMGVAIDMQKDGLCLISERRKRAKELGIEYNTQVV